MLLTILMVVLTINFSIQQPVAAELSNDDIMAAINALEINLERKFTTLFGAKLAHLMYRINDLESHLMGRINDLDDTMEQVEVVLKADAKNRFQKVNKALEIIKRDLNLIHSKQITVDSLEEIFIEIINKTQVFQNFLDEHSCTNSDSTSHKTLTCDQGWKGELCDTEICPVSEGFFPSPDGDQCFKEDRQKLSWSAAASFCESQDLVLAKPFDHNTAFVSKYLYDKHGGDPYWVNVRGTGESTYAWETDASVLNSARWRQGYPDHAGGRDYCVWLRADSSNPGRPYGDWGCSTTWSTLCEQCLMG